MSFSGFHPIVSRWFTDCVGVPTAAQVRGWAAIRDGRHALIAAPTGSGKTLAAFLTALDALVQESAAGPLPDEVRVVYVSPLKALSADIHKNLAEPRRGIRQYAERDGLPVPEITAAVRTGDTTQSERAAILRTPPHILVTTPESLYLLLTAERSRQMLQTVRTVIVDEIHAVIGTRRGAHLALSLERLQQVAGHPVQRIGLSATQKPVEDVARFLVGGGEIRPGLVSTDGDCETRPGLVSPPCVIVDEGHRRTLDLAIEIPRSPLEAVMAHEVWDEYYERLTQLIAEHKTTLVFVNTRRLAERLARYLSERLGDEAVTAHHGSLAKETRLDAEHRLKTGALKALVATASLELGIDIGHVDLVCQIGSPHRIATLLQRVGRSGHSIGGTPKGRLMPVSRDDLVECAALLHAVRAGELDRIVVHDAPLDVLAQQIAAEVSCGEHSEDGLFALVRRAWPYRTLPRDDFDAVVTMVSEGFATRRGRRAALVHRDEVHRRAARPSRHAPARDDRRRRDSGSRRLPGSARAGRHVHRHAQRRLRHREHGRRRVPARKRLLARRAGGCRARFASPTRRARRRTYRSGSAKPPPAATSCRARSRTSAPSSRNRWSPRRRARLKPSTTTVLEGPALAGLSTG